MSKKYPEEPSGKGIITDVEEGSICSECEIRHKKTYNFQDKLICWKCLEEKHPHHVELES